MSYTHDFFYLATLWAQQLVNKGERPVSEGGSLNRNLSPCSTYDDLVFVRFNSLKLCQPQRTLSDSVWLNAKILAELKTSGLS
ncbi:hypothetical protein BaRGS_00027870 [Batillaria attramentaria]|uniref:Uncharacterized protein n=1 Tax=Batillaria attramentaria TaxID=370345 RepID=A0ABD0K1F2_9CAEN